MDFISSGRSRFGVRRFISKRALGPGKVVQFTYDGNQRYGMIVHANWEGKMHVLAADDISEVELVEMFILTQGTNSSLIYERFKSSWLYPQRPYRTYLWTKIRTVREVYIKPEGDNNASTARTS